MSQSVTQKPKPRLTECNICRRAGFSSEMITFVNSGQKKPDGKIKWDLLNEDYSMHIHRSPTEKFEQIESDISKDNITKTPTENIQILKFDTNVSELYKQLIAAVRELSHSLNTTVISSLAIDEDSRNRVLERVNRQEKK